MFDEMKDKHQELTAEYWKEHDRLCEQFWSALNELKVELVRLLEKQVCERKLLDDRHKVEVGEYDQKVEKLGAEHSARLAELKRKYEEEL